MKKKKIIEWMCPKHDCSNIYSSKSLALFLQGETHPRCHDCKTRLIRRAYDELRK